MDTLLTSEQMRQIERESIDSGALCGLELMECAARGVLGAIFDTWPDLLAGKHRALVLCGPGNNGGDGFAIARLLQQSGWHVDVYLFGDSDKLPPDARNNYERWLQLGPVSPLSDDAIDGYADRWPDTKVAIDALFGTGLSRPFTTFGRVLNALNEWRSASEQGDTPHVVSVDVPSGLCADSGKYLGYAGKDPFDSAILANLTVTFHRMKLGHVLAEGALACGRVVVKDIGCAHPAQGHDFVTQVLCDQKMAHLIGKAETGHKYSNGAALVLSGGSGKSGAARLAARAALRVGAGVVTLGVPESAWPEVAAQITALMMTQIDHASDLRRSLADPRVGALCLGPGLGTVQAGALVRAGLTARAGLGIVLDADALTAFGSAPQELFDALTERCVLTPHLGEFRALFPDICKMLAADPEAGPAFSKVDAVRKAARRAGCTVLLKGPDTVIANQHGVCAIHSARAPRSAPWLASAGAGDVLAGLITGLLARGFSPMDAARYASYLHVECALEIGPGLIAEDLPDVLPRALARVIAQLQAFV